MPLLTLLRAGFLNSRNHLRGICLLLVSALICGCAKPRVVKLPPVVEGWRRQVARQNAYIVQKNDTLYSIAWAFDLDFHDLARINHINLPYKVRPGMRLCFAKHDYHKLPTAYTPNVSNTKPLLGWVWPTTSYKIINRYNPTHGGNKGINIAGVYGQPIVACSGGTVAYTGTGIPSYGKLIIIKHSEEYLSAYAHNQAMLVAEGDMVKAGQKIATMGKNNDGHIMLHFEVRRFGKPIDPQLVLKKEYGHK